MEHSFAPARVAGSTRSSLAISSPPRVRPRQRQSWSTRRPSRMLADVAFGDSSWHRCSYARACFYSPGEVGANGLPHTRGVNGSSWPELARAHAGDDVRAWLSELLSEGGGEARDGGASVEAREAEYLVERGRSGVV